jgi:hypothetical protein
VRLLQKTLLIILCIFQGFTSLIANNNISSINKLTHVVKKPINTIFIDGWFYGNFSQDIPEALPIIKLSENMSTTFLDLLNDLEKNDRYWQYYKTHSTKYIFSRSPRQWFSGKSLQQEINDILFHIKKLSEMLEKSIDELTKHLSTFDQKFDKENQKVWLSELMNTMYKISLSLSTLDDSTYKTKSECFIKMSFIDQCPELIKTFNNDKKYLNNQVKLTNKPNILMRNWVPTMLIGAATIAGSYYYCKNSDKVHGFVQDKLLEEYPSYVKDALKKHVIEPVKGIFNALFVDEKDDFSEKKLYKEVVDCKNNVLHNESIEVLSSTIRLYSENQGQDPNDVVAMMLNNGQEKSEVGYLLKMERDFETDITKLEKEIEGAWITSFTYLKQKKLYVDKIALDFLRSLRGCMGDVVVGCDRSIKEVNILLRKLTSELEEIKNLRKTLRLTIACIASVPASASVYYFGKGIKAIWNYFTKKDLQLIRYNFKRVNDELNENGQDRYGRLLYLSNRLRKAIEKNVISSKTHMRQDCLKDIAYLESRDASVKQKKKKLEIMMNYYSFLSHVN